MIRYVLAALLTAALVTMALPVIDDVAAANSQEQVRTEVLEIKEATQSLVRNEEVVSSGLSGGHQIVTIELPDRSKTSRAVRNVTIEPNHAHRFTTISYSVEGQSPEQVHIDAIVVGSDNGTVTLTGSHEQTLVLTLKRDGAGNRVVELRRSQNVNNI